MERLRQANSKEAQRQKLAAKARRVGTHAPCFAGGAPASHPVYRMRTLQLFDSCLARLKGCRAALLVSLRAARLGDATAAVTPSHAVAAAVRDVIRDELTAAGAGASRVRAAAAAPEWAHQHVPVPSLTRCSRASLLLCVCSSRRHGHAVGPSTRLPAA